MNLILHLFTKNNDLKYFICCDCFACLIVTIFIVLITFQISIKGVNIKNNILTSV